MITTSHESAFEALQSLAAIRSTFSLEFIELFCLLARFALLNSVMGQVGVTPLYGRHNLDVNKYEVKTCARVPY